MKKQLENILLLFSFKLSIANIGINFLAKTDNHDKTQNIDQFFHFDDRFSGWILFFGKDSGTLLPDLIHHFLTLRAIHHFRHRHCP